MRLFGAPSPASLSLVVVGVHVVDEERGVRLGRRGLDAVAEVHDVARVARLREEVT